MNEIRQIVDTHRFNVEELFFQAVEKDPTARQAFLEATCADGKVRMRVEALLKAHDSDGTFLDGPAVRIAPVAAPRQVGDYDILAEVGRGGMGVVYKARHRGLHRLAALKMVLAGEFASPAQEVRFRLEAELAARVQHANIVQVYEVGSHEGRPFLALEWVDGGSLAGRLDGTPWPPGEAAALVETLARAIHAAHCEGIVHRDLKPANVLLQGSGDRGQKSDGAPASAPLSRLCPKDYRTKPDRMKMTEAAS